MSSQSKDFKQLLKKGFVYHQTGNLSKAEKVYNQILNIEPENFDALQLKATLLYQSKKYQRYISIELLPEFFSQFSISRYPPGYNLTALDQTSAALSNQISL